MTHVVVGVFDDMGKIAKVKQELTSAGFSANDVTVKSQPDSGTVQGTQTGVVRDKEEGGIGHFFRSMFGMDDDDEHTGFYSEAVRRNNAVVTVNARDEDQVERAEDILDRCGAIDVDERSEQWRQEGWTPAASSAGLSSATSADIRTTGAPGAKPASTTGMRADTRDDVRSATAARDTNVAGSENRTIPVIEEELRVGKREVRRGGVRVFSRLRETEASETVQLREEHARVNRRPVDREATEADIGAFKESTVEVRETTEEPVVSKKARVIEEVEVGKDVSQREETVRDKVRRTDVEVEQLGGDTTDHDNDFRQHWTSTHADSGSQYDEYAPAYRYGSTLAGTDRYAGRSWEEIEPEARVDWEKRHPGSAWERFKDSVRYGWEKLTGSSDSGAARASQTTKGRSRPGRTV
jgi:uncharacterized protein (TIGR02271 family)